MIFIVFVLLFIVELLSFSKELWHFRLGISMLLLIMNLVAFCIYLLQSPVNFYLIVLFFIITFRSVNFLRIYKSRINEQYLKNAARKTSIWLFVAFASMLTINSLSNYQSFSYTSIIFLQTLLSLSLLIIVTISIVQIKKRRPIYNYPERDLPTISVCVPARNETTQVEVCISSLLANNYPKLEILVLDDCSSDSTAEVIKNYAHDGVRFIKGERMNTQWLAKNQAYQRLFEEASGQFILFCGVDTTFGPRTIQKLVALAMTQRLSMVSVLPLRLRSTLQAALIQPMRYWWELAMPRWLMRTPPVLSTCWLVDRKLIEDNGEFKAVKRSILPESYFARIAQSQKQYAFISSSHDIDVQTTKTAVDQRHTAIRVRYPQIHRKPELALVILLFELFVFVGPFGFVLLSFMREFNMSNVILACIAMTSSVVAHCLIVVISNPANVPIAVISFPFVVITEIILGLESMVRYEFFAVKWKDRNICIPIMQVVPRLPKS